MTKHKPQKQETPSFPIPEIKGNPRFFDAKHVANRISVRKCYWRRKAGIKPRPYHSHKQGKESEVKEKEKNVLYSESDR